MKNIVITLDKAKAVEAVRLEMANVAGRAELMGIAGVFDVMPVVDEEVQMIKDWMPHSLHDIRLLCGRKIVGMEESVTDEKVDITLSMPDNYPSGNDDLLSGYAQKYMEDELLLRWLRMCEAGSTMKGAGSPLGAQQARVRDADFDLLKSALQMRQRVGSREEKTFDEQYNDVSVWVEED